jgi:hypothetical protein
MHHGLPCNMTWLLVPLYPKLFVEAQSDCAWAMASRPSVPANATTPEELPCSPCHKVGWDKRSLHLIIAARPLMGSYGQRWFSESSPGLKPCASQFLSKVLASALASMGLPPAYPSYVLQHRPSLKGQIACTWSTPESVSPERLLKEI